jgi:glycosyltransferase involved in cell wall biosynthesis
MSSKYWGILSASMKVSVVIPVYNQAQFLSEAIQSVLDQTYQNFELIVVNDASPDHTEEVVRQFSDSRIRYMAHRENRGLPATRNTGMRAAKGEYIALLDADDFFHPEKLGAHVKFLEAHPDIGVTYNNRFELNYSAKTIRELYRPPKTVGLQDFVLGFPFAPSDMVIRKEWAEKINHFDERYVHGAEDLDFPIRLALSGCKFNKVDRALNYRRHHSERKRKNLLGRKADWVAVLENTFRDQRCPSHIKDLRTEAYTQHTLVLVCHAFLQDETLIGCNLLEEVRQLSPNLFLGKPSQVLRYLISFIIADENRAHPIILEKILKRISPLINGMEGQYEWAVGYGYLLKGVRAFIWGREEAGVVHFDRASRWKAVVDKQFLKKVASQIESIETELGADRVFYILNQLAPYIEKFGGKNSLHMMESTISYNRAHKNYHEGKYSLVPQEVGHTFIKNPRFLANRGAWSIFIRSLFHNIGIG